MPVNLILLAVLSGIIGVVITGFTAWHVYLAGTNTTTIEKLEKTRYLSPLRKTMQARFENNRNYVGNGNGETPGRQSIGDQLMEIHANALPGITRPEEGEDYRSSSPFSPANNYDNPHADDSYHANPANNTSTHDPHPGNRWTSPAQSSLHSNLSSYARFERNREQAAYDSYVDEELSSSLPHAFDLGWKRNLLHVFGPNPWLWAIPICNTTGDGWSWEASKKWIEASERVRAERGRADAERARWDEQRGQTGNEMPGWYGYSNGSANGHARYGQPPSYRQGKLDDAESTYIHTTSGVTNVPLSGRRSPGKAERILGFSHGLSTPLDHLDPSGRRHADHEDSGDMENSEDDENQSLAERRALMKRNSDDKAGGNWNDVPDDMVTRRTTASPRGSRGRGNGSRGLRSGDGRATSGE
jgi:palmitoyltransferase ZDHHC2/15/20